LTDGENVANCKGSLFTAVDEGAGVETFGCDEGFLAKFVTIWVAEDNTCERGATARVVNVISFTIPRM